jgi:hypothetical protein
MPFRTEAYFSWRVPSPGPIQLSGAVTLGMPDAKGSLLPVVNELFVTLLQKWYINTAAVQQIVALACQLGVSLASARRKYGTPWHAMTDRTTSKTCKGGVKLP